MNFQSANPANSTILIVDDNTDNLRLLSDMLSKHGYQTRRAISGTLALQSIEVSQFDLILLDINMPDIDGYEVCKRLRSDQNYDHTPIIFISALNDVVDKVKAFQCGGVDYITKPFQLEEVRMRVKTQLTAR
ncbi:MAG: response regulator, partial [Cyanobacteria bacterium J06558_2]